MKNSINENKIRINTILRETSSNVLDTYYTIYEEFLKGDKNAKDYLRIICEYPVSIRGDEGASQFVPPSVEEEIRGTYLDYLTNAVAVLVKSNYSPDEFYKTLFNMAFELTGICDSSEKSAALLKMLCRDVPEIPYYQVVDSVLIDKKEFTEHINSILPIVLEAFHMFQREFSQRTELTSQIYRLLQGLSKEDACIFLAVCFNMVEGMAYHAGKESCEKNEDND